MIYAQFLSALLTAYLAALAFYPALTLSRTKRLAVLLVLGFPTLFSPLLISVEIPLARFAASLNAIALFVKLYDLHIAADREPRPGWWTFLVFLPNWSSVVLRKLDDEPRSAQSVEVGRIVKGFVGLVAGCALLVALFRADWYGQPFLLEHSAKVLAFFLVLVPGTAALAALWRLSGGKAREPMDNPFAACTPADFWRRYNRPAQQFLYENVFKQAGGLRFPIRATLITFAISAIVHEHVFGVVIGRVQGYQTAFFLLQGCAVAATVRIKPKGWAMILWMIATYAFMLISSVLFFASVNQIVPFYSRDLPAWPWRW